MKVRDHGIKTDDISSEKIKDGTIRYADLDPNLRDKINTIDTNTKNILINSVEARILKSQDLDANLTVMIDTFDDDANIDPTSTNYEVVDGIVQLIQAGNLVRQESTKSEFDLGTYANCESVIDSGDGLLRKTATVVGETYVVPNFPTGIVVEMDGITVPESTEPTNTVEGTESSQATIDYPNIDSPIAGLRFYITDDLSTYKNLELSYKKVDDTELFYVLSIRDKSGNQFNYPQRKYNNSVSFQKIAEDLSLAVGVDLADIDYMMITTTYDIAKHTVLDFLAGSSGDYNIREGRNALQYISFAETTTVQVIKVTVRKQGTSPTRANLDIAIANAFGTTMGVGKITNDQLSNNSTWYEIYVTLDQPVTLQKGVEYNVVFQCPKVEDWERWEIRRSWYDQFPNYLSNANDRAENYTIALALYKPPIKEDIFFDNLVVAKSSTYSINNEFTSQPLNLGLVPSGLTDIKWDEVGDNDGIYLRLRFGNSESDVQTQLWSTTYANSLGSVISALSPNQWVQYQVIWTGGSIYGNTSIKSVAIGYTTPAGEGASTVISLSEFTQAIPDDFIAVWDYHLKSGTIELYISRDGKNSWQLIPPDQEGSYIPFTNGEGTEICLKAVLTGDAQLRSWGLATEEEFI